MLLETTIHRLRVFKYVAETGSFRAAADQLGITQPSVSAHIKALETMVGQPLFVRTRGRPSVLSEAGNLLHGYACTVIPKSDEFSAQMRELTRAGPKQLSIAAQRDLARYVLPGCIAEFSRSFSDIKLVLYSDTQESVLSYLRSGQADIALVFGSGTLEGISSEVVGGQPLTFVVQPNHELAHKDRLTPSDLAKYPFVSGLKGSNFVGLLQLILKRNNIDIFGSSIQLQDANTIKEVLRHYHGVACLPFCCVQDEVRNGTLVSLTIGDQQPMLEVRLAHRSPVSSAAVAFARYIRASTSLGSRA